MLFVCVSLLANEIHEVVYLWSSIFDFLVAFWNNIVKFNQILKFIHSSLVFISVQLLIKVGIGSTESFVQVGCLF
jgi:hypothetical protein